MILNLSGDGVELDGIAGTVRVCTDRAREHEVLAGPLRLLPFQGLIIERP